MTAKSLKLQPSVIEAMGIPMQNRQTYMRILNVENSLHLSIVLWYLPISILKWETVNVHVACGMCPAIPHPIETLICFQPEGNSQYYISARKAECLGRCNKESSCSINEKSNCLSLGRTRKSVSTQDTSLWSVKSATQNLFQAIL